MRTPAIERFLDRHPSLREAAAKVLAATAEVRAARECALPAGEPVARRHGAAEGELFAAVEALESLARTASPAAAEILAGAERVAAAALGLRVESHAFSPRRTTASPAARAALFSALAAFRTAFAELELEAQAAGAGRIPWQLELATHVAPGTPVAAMEISGYQLPSTPAARMAWGERCFLSGSEWNVDSHRSPALRYRSLDACFHSLAPEYHALFARLRAALEELRGRCPQAVERIVGLFPAVWEEYVAERSSPTFAKLGLLDFPSLAVSLNNMFRTYAERPLFGTRGGEGSFPTLGAGDRAAVALGDAGSGYVWESFDDVRVRSLRLAYGLERLGVSRGAGLGIIATRSCREFYLADFAAIFAGLISVGLQETLSDEQLAAVAAQARLSAVVCDGAELHRFLTPELTRRCPSLELLVVFDRGSASPPSGGPRLVELESLVDGGEIPGSWSSASGISPATGVVYGDEPGWRKAVAEGIRADADDELYTILFTSGSTGTPRGTMVTRRRWAEEMCFDANLQPHVSVSFQSPALAADRGVVWRTLHSGGRVGFARRGAAFFDDVRAVRPTIFDAPPVVWNTIYGEYKRAIRDPGLSRAAAAAVRRRFRNYLGGRLAFIATGGAASDPRVRETMETIFGVHMRDSYGTTETGNVAVDGQLVPGLDYRLIDVPEMGFSSRDRPCPRGELAVRTPHTTARYYHDEAGTREGFTADGYFLTGDVVAIGPGRRCTILGRRKQFFKLAGAEFVSPEALERHYLTSELVEAVLICASPTPGGVAAVVVPAHDGVTAAELEAEFRAIARRRALPPGSTPTAVVLAPGLDGALPWTVENGLLTPSLKLNRRALEAHYRDRIAGACARTEAAREGAGAGDDPTGEELGALTRRLVRIVAALLSLPPADVDPRRSFAELGGDSQSAMELMLRLEEVFSGKGTSREVGDPGELIESPLEQVARRLLAGRGAPAAAGDDAGSRDPEPAPSPPAGARSNAPPAADQAALANADAGDVPRPEPLPPAATADGVLLTGASGFLGVHLLAQLACSLAPERRIYALVRAASDDEAHARLLAALGDASLAVPAQGMARVVALAGVLEAERLGLAGDVYARLAAEVGLIYHLAAEVSFEKSYAELRGANVGGTRRLLELATTTTLKSFHFVSSRNVALVLGQSSGGRVWEESPLPARLSATIVSAQPGYAVSKWVGERMIRELDAHCRGGLRASVSRPALISWSQATGYANAGDWLTGVLASCLLMRRAIGADEVGVPRWVPQTPVSARGLDLVPADFAAPAIVRLGELTHRAALPEPTRPAADQVPTFHLSNLAPGHSGLLTLAHLMDMLVAADLRYSGAPDVVEYVPFSEWLSLAESAAAPLPVLPILAQLRRMKPFLERGEAKRFAAVAAGVPGGCPAIDQTLVDAYVRRVYESAPGEIRRQQGH